jgi:hypothetical protein
MRGVAEAKVLTDSAGSGHGGTVIVLVPARIAVKVLGTLLGYCETRDAGQDKHDSKHAK